MTTIASARFDPPRLLPDEPGDPTLQEPQSFEAAPDTLLAQGGLSRLKSWIDENLGNPNQHIYTLWDGPNDYMIRAVLNQNVTGLQPASIVLKTTLAGLDLDTGNPELSSRNFTVRHESSHIKTVTGTQIQLGYDVTRESRNIREGYSRNGEPVMDLISIEALGEGSLNRMRTELKLEPKSVSPKAVMQEALSLGGQVRWRRVWEDPATGEKRGIDVVLSAKAEGIAQTGTTGGLEGKAEIEASVRFIGGVANAADIHNLTDIAAREIARLLSPERNQNSALNSLNHGDPQTANYKYTLHMAFGASPWQLAPTRVSGGLNHGNISVDTAIRVNNVLHWSGYLSADRWVGSTAQAQQYLGRLWQDLSPEKREQFATYLANPMGLNFGIEDIRDANVQWRGSNEVPANARTHRGFFDGSYRQMFGNRASALDDSAPVATNPVNESNAHLARLFP